MNRSAVRLLAALLLALPCAATRAADGELPAVFAETFMVLPEDAAEAVKTGRRLLIYFGQDGCPYCRQLLETNFAQKDIVDKTRAHFLPIAINIWGDREVTWFDGRVRSEKEFARHLKVQFTPTVLLADERGNVVARINGYYPPARFSAALDYAAQRLEGRLSFAEHMQGVPSGGANAKLNAQPFFMAPPFDLTRKPGGKPLAVLFETTHCAACDELHRDGFSRPELKAALARFDVARFSPHGRDALRAPDGSATTAADWAKALGVSYVPSVVFFNDAGAEVFRLEAYVRPFHFTSSFEYVGSGAYRREPEFQRFLQNKAELIKSGGGKVDLLH